MAPNACKACVDILVLPKVSNYLWYLVALHNFSNVRIESKTRIYYV